MYPEISVWAIIVLAVVCANLPFLTERILTILPWRQAAEPERVIGFYLLRALLFYCFLGFAYYLLTSSFFPLSAKLLGGLIFLLGFFIPKLVYAKVALSKNKAIHLIESLVFLCFIAAIGLSIESYYANQHEQSWQFYAIGICLFALLAFPGVVWRYFMSHPELSKDEN